MNLLANMKIKDIDFGEIEGKDEFDLSTEENIERLKAIFVINELPIDQFLSANKRLQKNFVYGHKGTGKTSLLKYIEYKAKEKQYSTLSLLFKDIKYDPVVYSSFTNLLSSVKDKNTAAITFWQWFLLSVIVQQNDIDNNSEDLIFNAKNGIFKTLSKFLISILQGFQYKYAPEDQDVVATLNLQSLNINEANDYIQAGIKIKNLVNLINSQNLTHLYVFIDELETSKLSNNYDEEAILIKNLILTVSNLNRLFSNISFIAAIRSEVLENIFSSGDEINKILENKGYEIKWKYDNFTTSHPLILMVIKKMKYSMQQYSNDSKIIHVPDNDIFQRWFPEKLLRGLDGNNAKFLLNNTWVKPRDIIRLMKIMQSKAKDAAYFTQEHYDESVKEYSEKAWIEMKEELVSIMNQDQMTFIESVFRNYYKNFTYSEIKKRFKETSKLEELEINFIINKLYDIGFIGNHDYVNSQKIIYRYSFRGDRGLDTTMKIEVHRGLWKYFSLKDNQGEYKSNVADEVSDLHEKLQALGIR